MDSDPVIRFARDLAAAMMSARDMLCDDAYAAVLPHFEALRLTLPECVPAPRVSRSTLAAVPAPWPLDMEPQR